MVLCLRFMQSAALCRLCILFIGSLKKILIRDYQTMKDAYFGSM